MLPMLMIQQHIIGRFSLTYACVHAHTHAHIYQALYAVNEMVNVTNVSDPTTYNR